MKRSIITGLFLVLIIFATPLAMAWGVNPARQRATYSLEQQQFTITLENTNHQEAYFKVGFSGPLAPYAHYTTKLIYFDKNTASVAVPFSLKLPSDLPPGTNKLTISFTQVPLPQQETVGGLISLTANVLVDVPLNGNHLTAQLAIGASTTTTPTPITISMVNKGTGDIAVWADLSVKGPTNKELASWETQKQVLSYQGVGKITTQWEGSKEPGTYTLEATIHYDDKTIVLTDTFIVGSKEIISEAISSSSFSLGNIVPLLITVRNHWNEPVRDVFAEVFVLNKEGHILQTFKTASEDVPALGRTVLTGYWDTEKLVVGAYDINVIVHYEGGQTQQTYPVIIKANKLEVQTTGHVTEAEDSGAIGKNAFLILLVLILLATNIIIIMYFRKMKKS